MRFIQLLLLFASEQGAEQHARHVVMELAAGAVELSSAMVLPSGAQEVEVRGAKEGTVLRAGPGFHGAAILVANHITGLKIVNLKMEQIPGDGILIGEGTTDFEVSGCEFKKVGGAAIVVHGTKGRIANNTVLGAGRAAFLVAGASDIQVENNTAEGIGFGFEPKQNEIPAAIATTGETVRSNYVGNHFSEINGTCMSLEGFHDGEVRGNSCDSREAPEAYPNGGYGILTGPSRLSQKVLINGNTFDGLKFGGMFIAGSGYVITRNRLYRVNTSHCPSPIGGFVCVPSDGIYLASAGNLVEDNLINGFRMSEHCVGSAPGIAPDRNRVARNECSDDSTVNARNRVNQLFIGYPFEAVEH